MMPRNMNMCHILIVYCLLMFAFSAWGDLRDLRSHDLKRFVHLRNKVDRLQLQQKTDRIKLEILQKSVESLILNRIDENNVRETRTESVGLSTGQLLAHTKPNTANVHHGTDSVQKGSEALEFETYIRPHEYYEELRRDVADFRKELTALKLAHAAVDETQRQEDGGTSGISPAKVEQLVSSSRLTGNTAPADTSITGSSIARTSIAGKRSADTSIAGKSSADTSIAGKSSADTSITGKSSAGRSIPGKSPAGTSNTSTEGASFPGTFTSSSEENRRKEILWIEESWKRLQDLQEELEHKCNVTVAMHAQQEVESRLSGLHEGLTVLQEGLSHTAAQVSVSDSHLSSLAQEQRDTKEGLQSANTRLAAVQNEVTTFREDLDEVLSALPDGALSTGSLTESSGNNSGSAQPYVPSSLWKLRRSSVELMEALENLQSQREEDRILTNREFAKLEYNVSRTVEELRGTVKLFRSNIDRETTNEADITTLLNDVKMLGDSFNAVSLQQNDIASRLGKLEASLLVLPSYDSPLLRKSISGHLSKKGFSSSVSLPDSGAVDHGRSKAGPAMKHRRRRNKRNYELPS